MVNNLPANAEDAGSIPGSGRYPGEGNGNPLQYSCLENTMGRGAWKATVNGVTKSQTLLRDNSTTTEYERSALREKLGRKWRKIREVQISTMTYQVKSCHLRQHQADRKGILQGKPLQSHPEQGGLALIL